MRTYFVVVVMDDVEGTAWDIDKTGFRLDSVIFDSLEQVEKFHNHEAAYNALDDSTRLRKRDYILATYCILAPNDLEAYVRSTDICKRFQ